MNPEIEKFDRLSSQWWNLDKEFAMLHRINPIRTKYVVEKSQNLLKRDLLSISVLDIGCGGGILTESIYDAGLANIVGIDESGSSICVADKHKIDRSIQYINCSTSDLIALDKSYDIVIAMEVIEHVANYQKFLQECSSLLKVGGLLFVATINRTIKSLILAKIAAEYIIGCIPRNTHSWQKFLRPSEINACLEEIGLELYDITGVEYRALLKEFIISDNLDMNYMMCFIK